MDLAISRLARYSGHCHSRTKPLIEGEHLKGITGLVDPYLGVASDILVFTWKSVVSICWIWLLNT